MSGLASVAGRHWTVAVVLVAAGAACVLAALHSAYRRTLLRVLRDRHPDVWDELVRPAPPAPAWRRSARRLAAFLRSGRHYTLNDADLAAAGRLCVVTARASIALGLVAVIVAWLSCAG